MVTLDSPFHFELGGSLPSLSLVWEEWGSHNDDVVLVVPSLSVGSHAKSSVKDPRAGWWESIVGSGIDTDKFRVVCPANIGSPFGATSPASSDGDGVIGIDFPQITTVDIARAHFLLLDHLGVDRVHAIVGASLGGCVTLSMAAEAPDRVANAVAIACTGRTAPGTIAFRHVQRQAVVSDPEYRDGRYHEEGTYPTKGMRVARQLGMITYRTPEEFNDRFVAPSKGPYGPPSAINFKVEEYLMRASDAFVENYDPNCFIRLSKCADLMDLGRGHSSYSKGLLRIKSPLLVIGTTTDMIIPLNEQEDLAKLLQAHGKQVSFKKCLSVYGHDSFMLEDVWFNKHLREFLEEEYVK